MKILFVSDRSLFAEGLEGILRDEVGIEFAGRTVYSDALIERIEQCRPEVVLLDCTEPEACPVRPLVHCLRNGLLQWIVCVSLRDNTIFVLRGERRVLQDISDLVAAITGLPPECQLAQPPGCSLSPAGEKGGEAIGHLKANRLDQRCSRGQTY